jgi:hypothetical protein
LDGPVQDRSPKSGKAAWSGKQIIELPVYIPLEGELQVFIPRLHEEMHGKPRDRYGGDKLISNEGETWDRSDRNQEE